LIVLILISYHLFKFYEISDKNLATYHSYLDNRHCRTAKYNDRDKSNKVSSWAKVRHVFPQGPVLGPLLFLDLPKIINKT